MTVHYQKLSPTRPNWLGGDKWELKGLTDITIIFGRNSSGKSILLRKLNDEFKLFSHYTSPERAGTITYAQNLVDPELNISSRGNSRRGKNQALQFRQETISRIGALKMKMGDKAGYGEQVKTRWGKITKSIGELLPEFKFSIQDEPPLFKLQRIPIDESEPSVAKAEELIVAKLRCLHLRLIY